jgi:hypothetical protein
MNFWRAGFCYRRFDCISSAQLEILRDCATMIPGLCSGRLLSASAMRAATAVNQSLCVKTPDTAPEERTSFNLRHLIGARRCFSTHGWRVRKSNQDDEEQENGCGCPEKKVGDIAVEVKKEGTDQI